MPPFCLFSHRVCARAVCYIQASVFIRQGTKSKLFPCHILHFLGESPFNVLCWLRSCQTSSHHSFIKDSAIYLFSLSYWILSTVGMELSDRPLILQLIKLEENSQRQSTRIDARALLDWPWCCTCHHEKMSLELALILYLTSPKNSSCLTSPKILFLSRWGFSWAFVLR